MTFDELDIHDELKEAISYMNFERVSPIQEAAIPVALSGKDILACAQTGTGKTASFVIPILDDLIRNGNQGTTSLIIVPTRELALQIDQEVQGFSYFTMTSSKAIFGGDKGKDWNAQKQAITEGTNVIIATPGRLMQHLALGYVDFSCLRHLVLDEADRMLDMGFYDDIKQIVTYIKNPVQTLLFSATMAPNIRTLAHKILHNPETITIAIAKPAAGVTQSAYMAYPNQKIKIIHHIITINPTYDSILIFTATKRNVNNIVTHLQKTLPMESIAGISSDLEQKEREDVLVGFKSKQIKILVATDVLSRGIDIKGINLIINFDVPADPADYVHRVGRTARADSKGEAITLISDVDIHKFKRIETLIGAAVEKREAPKKLGNTPLWNKAASHTQGANRKKTGHTRKTKNKSKFVRKPSSNNNNTKQ
ncbi:MAG: DEAD/DEAH box helicase [Bacteroidales bacterium]|nr:DEAD/DEAH box helicase [Bacteroidales bacterium]